MLSDTRLLLLLQRGLLTCALALPAALVGCGGSEDKGTDEGNANADDDNTDDGDDTSGDGTGTAKKDGGGGTTVKKDGGGGVVKNDGGTTPITGLDSGTPGGKTDAGTPPVVTGDAPTEASATAAGPLKVTTYASGYADSAAYADATMHYPEGAGPFPAIAIVPGYLSPQDSIQKWGPFLASHGIITFTIGTNSPLDDPPTRSAALLGAIETIKGENTREGSAIKGKVDLSRLGIGGWSMGGGGTLITLNSHPEFKAAIAFCPWDVEGTTLATFPKITTPTLFLAAEQDTLAKGQSQPFYDSIPDSTPKILWERKGATHFQNDPSFENGAMGRYGLSWLKTYLVGDDRYKQFLLVKAPNASDWKTNVK